MGQLYPNSPIPSTDQYTIAEIPATLPLTRAASPDAAAHASTTDQTPALHGSRAGVTDALRPSLPARHAICIQRRSSVQCWHSHALILAPRLAGCLPGGPWSTALAGVAGVRPPPQIRSHLYLPGVSAVRRDVLTCTVDGVRPFLFY